jgi:hypothetical protein
VNCDVPERPAAESELKPWEAEVRDSHVPDALTVFDDSILSAESRNVGEYTL